MLQCEGAAAARRAEAGSACNPKNPSPAVGVSLLYLLTAGGNIGRHGRRGKGKVANHYGRRHLIYNEPANSLRIGERSKTLSRNFTTGIEDSGTAGCSQSKGVIPMSTNPMDSS